MHINSSHVAHFEQTSIYHAFKAEMFVTSTEFSRISQPPCYNNQDLRRRWPPRYTACPVDQVCEAEVYFRGKGERVGEGGSHGPYGKWESWNQGSVCYQLVVLTTALMFMNSLGLVACCRLSLSIT